MEDWLDKTIWYGYPIVVEDRFRDSESSFAAPWVEGLHGTLGCRDIFHRADGKSKGVKWVRCMKFENSNQRWRNSLEGDKVTGVNGRLSRGWRAGYRGEPSRGNSRWLDDLCCKNKIEDMKDSIVNIIKRNRRYYFYRNYSFKIALTFSSFSLRREIFLYL